MQNLTNMIHNGLKISILNHQYTVKAKSFYVTQHNPDSEYVKIFFDGQYVLVLSPDDNLAYFGQDIGNVGFNHPFENIVTYNNKECALINQDYQIPVRLEFGSPLETEGEVEFWDYQCDDEIISVGIIKRTGERSDIVGKEISVDDIKIIGL